MAGIRAYHSSEEEWHEFIYTEFDSPLDSNWLYKVSFQASPGEYALYSTDDIGLCLSEVEPISYPGSSWTPGSVHEYYKYNPQIQNPEGDFLDDANIWYEIGGMYKADGSERFLIIGNFKPDEKTTYQITWENEFSQNDPSAYLFIDEIVVEPCPINIELDFMKDTLLCLGERLDLDATHQGATYLWQDGTTSPNYMIQDTGYYSVEVSTSGCTYSKSMHVSYFPEVNFGQDVFSCDRQKINLTLPTSNIFDTEADYLWSTGSNETSISVNQSDYYWGEISFEHCTVRDTITVDFVEEATSVFPNPSSGDFTINSSLGSITHYRLFNSIGQLLVDELTNSSVIDFSFNKKHNGGLYLLEIETNGCHVEKKIIIY